MARPDDDEFIDVSEEIAEGEEGKGYGRADGPDSQGERAGEGFGSNAQGGAGDEDFDPSYQREHHDGRPEAAGRQLVPSTYSAACRVGLHAQNGCGTTPATVPPRGGHE